MLIKLLIAAFILFIWTLTFALCISAKDGDKYIESLDNELYNNKNK